RRRGRAFRVSAVSFVTRNGLRAVAPSNQRETKMAWTKFTAPPKASAGTGVTATLRKGKTGSAKMNFTIRPDLASAWGWTAGDKLEVLIGNGEHHGLVRFRKNNSVGTVEVVRRAGVHGSHYFTLTLGHLAAYVDRSE